MKSADKNEKKDIAYNDIFYMQTKPDSTHADFISFYTHLNGSVIDFYVENAVPVYIDYPKTKIIINDTIYRLNTFGVVDELGVKYYEPIEKRQDVLNKQDLFGSIQLPDVYFYDLYKQYEDANYQNVNYLINNENIPISTIQFLKENTPVFIRAEIMYYIDSDYRNVNMAEVNLYQSDLLKISDIREEKYKQKVYKLGTDIANEVPDVSFYTRNKTGKIWGLPEMQVGLLKAGSITLAAIATILYIAVDVEFNSD